MQSSTFLGQSLVQKALSSRRQVGLRIELGARLSGVKGGVWWKSDQKASITRRSG
jgi:hypothetical protein